MEPKFTFPDMLLSHSKMVLLHLKLAYKSYHINFSDFVLPFSVPKFAIYNSQSEAMTTPLLYIWNENMVR